LLGGVGAFDGLFAGLNGLGVTLKAGFKDLKDFRDLKDAKDAQESVTGACWLV
jgi:hypothetical protein